MHITPVRHVCSNIISTSLGSIQARFNYCANINPPVPLPPYGLLSVSRASDSQLREPGFESFAAISNSGQVLFTLHCPSSRSFMNGYVALGSGGYWYTNSLRALIGVVMMLPTEVDMVFDRTGLPGSKV